MLFVYVTSICPGASSRYRRCASNIPINASAVKNRLHVVDLCLHLRLKVCHSIVAPAIKAADVDLLES